MLRRWCAEKLRRSKKQRREKKVGDSIPRQIARSRSSSCDTKAEPPSVYLVVGHGVTRPAYSVFKVNPFLGDGGDTPAPLTHHLARLAAKHSMAFVPVRSRHGPWIVGVGGNTGCRDYGPETIVFDTKTGKAIPGPKLLSTKIRPILLPFGERIYALTGCPAVTGDVDFVPWFEVLDLSMARVDDQEASGCCLVDCEWKALPRPPFFPWDLTPTDYIYPPLVAVKSHVAVGSYILLSITGQTGTHMFNVETEQWAKLDNKDLPFSGRAVPHGTLFLGFSNATGKIAAFKINVCASAVPYKLSIVEIQIVADEAEEEIASTGGFISLNYPAGNPAFCSFTCVDDDPVSFSSNPQYLRGLITIRAYSTEDYLESTCTLVISNQWKQVYSIYDPIRQLSSPCLAGAISL